MTQNRVWFITGASSGLGFALARLVLSRGERVFATGRRNAPLLDLEALGAEIAPLDVTKPVQIASAVTAVQGSFGGVDVLVNSAGYAQLGAIEETSDADSRAQFDVNVFGLMNVIRAALPLMRRRGGGRILNFSSLAGFVGMIGAGNYCASKFAVEGLSEALGAELAPFEIKVIIVEPGSFRTGFVDGVRLASPIEAYAPTVGQLRAWMETDAPRNGGNPDDAALAIFTALESPEPPLRLLIGDDAIAGARVKLSAMQSEFEKWAPIGLMKNE